MHHEGSEQAQHDAANLTEDLDIARECEMKAHTRQCRTPLLAPVVCQLTTEAV